MASCGGPPRPPPIGNVAPAPEPVDDPAQIAGRWSYTAESTCTSEKGSGWVEFAWDRTGAAYREVGEVSWPGEPVAVRWWGTAHIVDEIASIVSDTENSLHHKVRGYWRVVGEPPGTLKLEWQQTNGCMGLGVAARVVDL